MSRKKRKFEYHTVCTIDCSIGVSYGMMDNGISLSPFSLGGKWKWIVKLSFGELLSGAGE